MNDFTKSQKVHAIRRHNWNANVFMKLISMFPAILIYCCSCPAMCEGDSRIFANPYETVENLPTRSAPFDSSQSSQIVMAVPRPENSRKYPRKNKEVKAICKKQTKISYFPRCLLTSETWRTVFFDGG